MGCNGSTLFDSVAAHVHSSLQNNSIYCYATCEKALSGVFTERNLIAKSGDQVFNGKAGVAVKYEIHHKAISMGRGRGGTFERGEGGGGGITPLLFGQNIPSYIVFYMTVTKIS